MSASNRKGASPSGEVQAALDWLSGQGITVRPAWRGRFWYADVGGESRKFDAPALIAYVRRRARLTPPRPGWGIGGIRPEPRDDLLRLAIVLQASRELDEQVIGDMLREIVER